MTALDPDFLFISFLLWDIIEPSLLVLIVFFLVRLLRVLRQLNDQMQERAP